MADVTDGNAVKEIVDVAGGVALPWAPHDHDSSVIDGAAMVRLPLGWTTPMVDFESLLSRPRRAHGTYTVNSVESFGDLWAVFSKHWPAARVYHWADLSPVGPAATHALAVFNGDAEEPGWGDLRVNLALERTVIWTQITSMFNKPMGQVGLGRFLEDNDRYVTAPVGAALLNMVLQFEATKEGKFASSHRLDNGDQRLVFEEVTTVTSEVEIPKQVTFALPPYAQHDDIRSITCRLRYAVEERKVKFTLEPAFWPEELQDIHDNVLARIKALVDGPLIAGRPR